MKKIKFLFAFFVGLCFCFYLIDINRYFQLRLLWIVIGLMLLLSFINYKESYQKIKSLFKFEIILTRGFVFCIASLPIFYMIWDKRYIEVVNQQILIYWLGLIMTIFNFGISTEKREPSTKDK